MSDEVVMRAEGLGSRLLGFLLRVYRLARVMPPTSAMILAGRRRARIEAMGVRLKPLGRTIFLRPGTSDLACIEQVFVNDDYALPFELDPTIIVDAGANIGASVLYFSNKFPKSTIIALEPETSNFELLTKNCAELANVICLNAALWPEDIPLAFSDPSAEKWALAVTPSRDPMRSINAITIQTLLEQFQITRIDILKLDIEGSERELFSMDVEKWLSYVDTFIIELHDRYKKGCSQAFYSALYGRDFRQEIRGENIVVRLERVAEKPVLNLSIPERICLAAEK